MIDLDIAIDDNIPAQQESPRIVLPPVAEGIDSVSLTVITPPVSVLVLPAFGMEQGCD
jgi:hypothetical protein